MTHEESLLNALEQELNTLPSYERENFGELLKARLANNSRSGVSGMNRGGNPTKVIRVQAEDRSVAQFDIVAKRLTNSLQYDLPFVFFGYLDFESAYKSILEVLPAGLTLTVTGGVHDGQPDKVIFSYTDGVNTDNIEVTCNQMQYPSFLKATGDDMFRLSKIRYSISNITSIDQFQKELKVINRTMFGRKNEDSISITASKSPDQFQSTIVDLDYDIEVDRQTNIKHTLRQEAGFSVTLSMFVEKFNRRVAGDMR